MNWLLAES